jgi:hypothetical protein
MLLHQERSLAHERCGQAARVGLERAIKSGLGPWTVPQLILEQAAHIDQGARALSAGERLLCEFGERDQQRFIIAAFALEPRDREQRRPEARVALHGLVVVVARLLALAQAQLGQRTQLKQERSLQLPVGLLR